MNIQLDLCSMKEVVLRNRSRHERCRETKASDRSRRRIAVNLFSTRDLGRPRSTARRLELISPSASLLHSHGDGLWRADCNHHRGRDAASDVSIRAGALRVHALRCSRPTAPSLYLTHTRTHTHSLHLSLTHSSSAEACSSRCRRWSEIIAGQSKQARKEGCEA